MQPQGVVEAMVLRTHSVIDVHASQVGRKSGCHFSGHRFKWLMPDFEPVYLEQKINMCGTSLLAQWLRIHLPMQGTRVRALVQEDPTCRGATKPVLHNY